MVCRVPHPAAPTHLFCLMFHVPLLPKAHNLAFQFLEGAEAVSSLGNLFLCSLLSLAPLLYGFSLNVVSD